MPIPPSRQNPATLIIVAPGLLSLPDALLASSTPLARLTALAAGVITVPGGIDAATAAAVGYRGALAPLAALGAGFDPAGEWVTQADPVHIEVGATDALVTGRVDDLDADEARQLVADINDLLGSADMRVVAPRSDRWFALSSDDIAGEAIAVDAVVGRGLAETLRRGDDARKLARLRGEIEMLLHDHPVNRQRAERGATSVDGLWLWGGGRRSSVEAGLPKLRVGVCPGRVGDVARGLAIVSRGRIAAPDHAGIDALLAEPDDPSLPDSPLSIIAVSNPLRSESDLDALGRDLLTVALARLYARKIGEAILVADGGANAVTWRVRAPGALRRLTVALRGPHFVRP